MSKHQYINDLQSKLEAFKYFEQERLKMLMVGIDLQIALRELQDIENKTPELEFAVHTLSEVKRNYDSMFVKYETATIKLTEIRDNCLALSRYTLDLEKQLKATEEL